MRNTIITGLAIVGVLGAGVAAAAVNTSIFDAPEQSASAATAIITPQQAPSGVEAQPGAEPIVVQVSRDSPNATNPSTSAPATTTPLSETDSPWLTEFAVGETGLVTLDMIDGQLALVSAAPEAGWSVHDTEVENGEVEVTFRSESTEVEFAAEIVDGQIVTFVNATDIGGTPAPRAGNDEYGGDEDDDDGDDDDHEQDEDEDDDDEDDDDEEYEDD